MPSLIGNKPNQVSTNGDLGTLAFQDASNVKAGSITADTVLTNGNVGIGTSSPSELLTVSSADAPTIRINNSDTSLAAAQEVGSLEFYTNDTSTRGTGIASSISSFSEDSFGVNNYLTFATRSDSISSNAVERMRIDSSGNLRFNSGYGSVALAYGCRAWVNFNGTGTVAIRASGNVSSVTDNGTGDYTVNFTTAMPDANYAIGGYAVNPASRALILGDQTTYASGSFRFTVGYTSGFNGDITLIDASVVNIEIFR